jgi:hypothetical protein
MTAIDMYLKGHGHDFTVELAKSGIGIEAWIGMKSISYFKF